MQLVAQTHLLESGDGARTTLGFRNSRKCQRQFHIGKHILVRNEVVALKHKAYAVISVRIPVAVPVFLSGNAVDDQITRSITVKTTNDVEHGGFTATGLTENSNEFAIAKLQADALQGMHRRIPRNVVFLDVFQLEHTGSLSLRCKRYYLRDG